MFIYENHLAFAVFDRNAGQITFEVKEERDWDLQGVFLNGLLAVCFSYEFSIRLCVWKIDSPSHVSLLNQWTFEGGFIALSMDEKYHAVSIVRDPIGLRPAKLHLISTKDLEVEKTLC
jgi:hypothetical protein